MSSFLKDLISVGLSRGGVIIFGLLQSVIIARWLGPELNGTIAALLVYPSLFMTIGSLGIRQSTAYFIGKEVYSEKQIKTAVSQIWVISSIVSLLSCFVLIKYLSNSGDDLPLILLAIAPIPFALFNTYNSGIFLGKNQIQAFNKINWLPPFFILLATSVLVILLNLSIQGALIALFIGPLVMSLIMLFKNRFIEALSFKIDWKPIKSLFSLGIVYATALFVINLNYRIDVIIIDKLSTAYEVGIYSKGSALIQYLWQIPMLLSTIIFARSAIAKHQRNFSLKVCKLLRVSIIVISLGCLVLGLLAPWIIELLFGAAFLPSTSVLIYLIPGVLLLTIFKVLNMDLAGRGKPWVAMTAMVPALVVNVVLNIIWVPDFGANGAAIASTISYSIAALLFLWVYSREVKIPIRQILRYEKQDFEFINILLQKLKTKLK